MKRAVRYAKQDMKREINQGLSRRISAAQFLSKHTNRSMTENGAIGYKTTTHPLVDLNFMVSSFRNRSEEEIVKAFVKAYYKNPKYAVKWLFFLRDILEGMGERRTFRVCLNYLAVSHTKVARAVIKLVPEYGRYDDWLVVLDTPLCCEICELIKEQLNHDILAMESNQPVSLLAKWLPSANSSSKESRRLALRIINQLGISEREYRKTLSKIRAYSDVLEVKLSSSRWDEVDYNKVPAKANLKYNDAFLRHDEQRRVDYFVNVDSGNGNLNSKGLMPYEIVHKLVKRTYYLGFIKEDKIAELLWQKLLQDGYQNEWGLDDCIVVADGSGSMNVQVSNKSKYSAMEICHSLAIYFAQRLQGVFHDKVITFSEDPQFIDLAYGKSLKDKLEIMLSYTEVSNTNIEAVFDLLLDMAVCNQVPKEEIPKQILIISDMEFDMATQPLNHFMRPDSRGKKFEPYLFQVIEKKYRSAGYELPRLIFWNVVGRTDTIPMIENKNGLCLISGFSQNAIKVATNKEAKSPYDSLIQTLDSPRYEKVEESLASIF